MNPSQKLQEMLATIAEEAFRQDEKELSIIITVILGSYRFGSLEQYIKATEAYLGEQSKKAVLQTVAQSVEGLEPLLFSQN